MAARDSDDDIRNYLPDLNTILREADPARAKEKLAKAQDNPELDAALAHAKRPSAPLSDASPWAAEPAGIEAAALPSSLAAPPVVVVKKPEAKPRKGVVFSPWAKAIVAVLAAVGPVTLLWVLLVRPSGGGQVEPARAGASTVVSSAAAAPTMSASAAAISSAPVVAPTPAVTADADAGAKAAPAVPQVTAPTKVKAAPGTREDPYDAAPLAPAKTVDPVAPPTPAAPPAPTSSSWF